MVGATLAKIAEALRAARADPAHPLRARMDAIALEFADKLAAGDADAAATLSGRKPRSSTARIWGRCSSARCAGSAIPSKRSCTSRAPHSTISCAARCASV